MNEIELTKLFIEISETQSRLDALKAVLEEEILERKESYKVAGITATYYKPSYGTPDYEGAARAYMKTKEIPEEFLEKFSTTTVTVKWKDVCEDFMIVPPQGIEKPARVVIK